MKIRSFLIPGMVVVFHFSFIGCTDDVPDQSNTSRNISSDADSDTDSDTDSDADADTSRGGDTRNTKDTETVFAVVSVCRPGEIQSCTCGDVSGGVVKCNSAGDGWSNCICDGGGDTDSEMTNAVDSETSSNTDFTCASGEAQLHVLVTANMQSKSLPWELWPSDADGEGNLVVSLTTENGSVARDTVMPAHFASGTAEIAVDFCTEFVQGKVEAFLDDDLDAAPGAIFSGDYVDTCMGTNGECFRCMNVRLSPNTVTEVNAVLEGSCD